MSAVAQIAEQFLIDHVVLSNKPPISGKNKVGFGLFALSGLSFALGLGFVGYGTHLYIAANYPPDVAAFMTGGLSMIFAVVIACAGYFFLRYRKYKISKIKADISETITNAIDIFGDDSVEAIKNNPKTSVLVASVAGFIAGEKLL